MNLIELFASLGLMFNCACYYTGYMEGFVYFDLVDINGCNAEMIDQFFTTLIEKSIDLYGIFITNSTITTFPSQVKKIRYLKHLTIEIGLVTELNGMNDGTSNVGFLSLAHNEIADIQPGFFSSFPLLHTLDLSFNHMQRIGDKAILSDCQSLEEIKLMFNRISSVDTGFFILCPRLRYLNLSNNYITRLQHNIISRNETNKIDLENGNLNALRILHISHNRIIHIQDGFFSHFPNVRDLDLSYNYLEHLSVKTSLEFNFVKLDRLDISHNNILYINPDVLLWLPCMQDIDLSNNNLTSLNFTVKTDHVGIKLNLKNNRLTQFIYNPIKGHHQEKEWPNVFKELDLSYNQLSNIPENLQQTKVEMFFLQGNPLHCDCDLIWMKTWILQSTTSTERARILCSRPFFNKNETLVTLENHRFICDRTIYGIASATMLGLGLIFGSIILYKWRYEWKFYLYNKYGFHPFDRDDCENENKRFDLFVSYSNDDSDWARALIEDLKDLGFCVCFHEQDFHAGTTIAENVERAVHYSKRTLCIVSRAFMESNFCMHEFITARSFDFTHKKNRLIMIMYEDVPCKELHEEIRLYQKTFTFLKKDCAFFMKKLLYVLPQKNMGNQDGERIPLLMDTNQQHVHCNRNEMV